MLLVFGCIGTDFARKYAFCSIFKIYQIIKRTRVVPTAADARCFPKKEKKGGKKAEIFEIRCCADYAALYAEHCAPC